MPCPLVILTFRYNYPNLNVCSNCDACTTLREEAQRESNEEDKECRRFFREMSIVQEISATPGRGLYENNGRPRERIAIFLWRFRRTRLGEAATTTWRRLTRPVSAEPNANALPEPSTILASNALGQQNSSSYLGEQLDPGFFGTSEGMMMQSNWEMERAYPASKELFAKAEDITTAHREGYRIQSDLTPTDSTFSSNTIGQSTSTSYSNSLRSHPLSQGSFGSNAEYINDLTLHDNTHSGDFRQDQQYANAVVHAYMGAGQRFPNDGVENVQDSTSFSQFNLDDFSFEAVTDPGLLSDYGHTNIQLNIGSQTAAEASFEQTSYHLDPNSSSVSQFQVQEGSNNQSSSILHPNLPRRLISAAHSTTNRAPALNHHSTRNTTQLSTPVLQLDLDRRKHRNDQELCGDGELLASLADESHNDRLEGGHLALDRISRDLDRIQQTAHEPNMEELHMSLEQFDSLERRERMHNGHVIVESLEALSSQLQPYDQTNSFDHLDSVHSRQADIHTAHQPPMALLPSPVIVERGGHHGEHHNMLISDTRHKQQPSWPTITSLDDHAWVRDFAIAQLEGMIEHANAMDPALVTASGPHVDESNTTVLEHPIKIENALGIGSDDTIVEDIEGEGRVLGELEGEDALEEEQIGDWEHVEVYNEDFGQHTIADHTVAEDGDLCD